MTASPRLTSPEGRQSALAAVQLQASATAHASGPTINSPGRIVCKKGQKLNPTPKLNPVPFTPFLS